MKTRNLYEIYTGLRVNLLSNNTDTDTTRRVLYFPVGLHEYRPYNDWEGVVEESTRLFENIRRFFFLKYGLSEGDLFQIFVMFINKLCDQT